MVAAGCARNPLPAAIPESPEDCARRAAHVPATAPDTLFISAAERQAFIRRNEVWGDARMSGPFARSIVAVAFRPEASVDDRRAAIHAICGEVIGGGWASYLVRIADDGTTGPLWRAADYLETLPIVEHAGPDLKILVSVFPFR